MSQHPCVVLVVDDNRDCADSTAILLRVQGHEAHTAYSPEEAIRQVKAVRPDVILMDIGLPGKDGIQVAREVQAVCPGCRIIALTGFADEQLRRACHANGIKEMLVKPAEPEAMHKVVSDECEPATS